MVERNGANIDAKFIARWVGQLQVLKAKLGSKHGCERQSKLRLYLNPSESLPANRTGERKNNGMGRELKRLLKSENC